MIRLVTNTGVADLERTYLFQFPPSLLDHTLNPSLRLLKPAKEKEERKKKEMANHGGSFKPSLPSLTLIGRARSSERYPILRQHRILRPALYLRIHSVFLLATHPQTKTRHIIARVRPFGPSLRLLATGCSLARVRLPFAVFSFFPPCLICILGLGLVAFTFTLQRTYLPTLPPYLTLPCPCRIGHDAARLRAARLFFLTGLD
jgi:hypothetical protein